MIRHLAGIRKELMFPLLGAIGAGLFAGVNAYGQQSANEMNAYQAEQNRIFQDNTRKASQNWQEYMRGTAYQSTMNDMKAAGLNPIMAFGQGATNTPSAPGASGGSSVAPMQNVVGSGVDSAMTAARTLQDLKTAGAQQTLLDAQSMTQLAQAERETATATQIRQATRQTGYGEKAVMKEATAREKKADLDSENLARERILNQVATGAGIARDASWAGSNIKDMLNPLKGLFNGKEGYKREDLLRKGWVPPANQQTPKDFFGGFLK